MREQSESSSERRARRAMNEARLIAARVARSRGVAFIVRYSEMNGGDVEVLRADEYEANSRDYSLVEEVR